MSESPGEKPLDGGGLFRRLVTPEPSRDPERLSGMVTAVVALLAVVLLADYVTSAEFGSTADVAAGAGFAGTCVALPLATRWPVVAAGLFGLGGAAFVLVDERVGLVSLIACVLVALIGVASRPIVASASVAALTGWAAWMSLELFGDVSYVPPFLLFAVPALLVGMAFRRIRSQLAQTARKNRELARLQQEARIRERESLARDLHDVVSHQLTIISLVSGSRRRSTDAEKLRSGLNEIHELSGETLAELRKLLAILRDPDDFASPRRSLQDMTLCEGVDYLEARLRELGFDVDCDVQVGPEARFSTSTVTSALRILQESITNIAKYAQPATQVSIALSCSQDWLSLSVESCIPDGTGRRPAPAPSSGQGIIGIRERADLLGGHAAVGRVGDVWSVRAALPV